MTKAASKTTKGKNGVDERAFAPLAVFLGLGREDLETSVRLLLRRLTDASKTPRAELVPVGGGKGVVVQLDRISSTARTAADVHLPGFEVRPHRPAEATGERALESFRDLQRALEATFRDTATSNRWLREPNPALGDREPIDFVLEGRPEVVTATLEAARAGVGL